MDSLQSEPQGKPNNTGVGSPSLLQWIFLIQESNQGLLHCRQILYQLSYQGSPDVYHFIYCIDRVGASLVAQMVKDPSAMQETWV